MANNPIPPLDLTTNYFASPPDVDESFNNPMNYANMNPGWGINPSMLTPSHLANYRPHYAGPQPYSGYQRMGFGQGLNALAPWSAEPIWGNPVQHQQQAIASVSERPADAAAWVGQRIATPIAAYAAGRAFTEVTGLGFRSGAAMGSSFAGGFSSGLGMNTPGGLGLRGTAQSIKSAYTAGGFRGAFSAMGEVGFGGAANLAARGTMGLAGGLAASVVAPLAVGQGIISASEKGIWNPYINTRQSARDLRENFAGISFGDSEGNVVTGKGLSYKESNRMASEITSQGIGDMSFSTNEYREGADMVQRAGLADNVSASGITKRVKESMDQVKLIMSIASMPEMKDAIEQLAKLQQGGASLTGGYLSNATEAMNSVGRLASSAGTSVQKLMNTVGAQGQYMYQANGMTPYMGQVAAATAYSALAAGQRTGLLGTAQIARMGGIEGATQSSLAGQMNVSQNYINRMALANADATGRTGYGSSSGAVGIITSFGNRVASDPLGSLGDMLLHSKQRAANQMAEQGTGATQDQLLAIARNLPGVMNSKDGKISAEKAAPLLQSMGMQEDEIKAFFAQNMAETDEDSYRQKLKGLNAFGAEQTRQYISQTGTYGGKIGGTIYDVRKAGRKLTNNVQRSLVRPVTNAIGAAGDFLGEATDDLWFGVSLKNPRNEDVESLLSDAPSPDRANSSVALFDETSNSSQKGGGAWGRSRMPSSDNNYKTKRMDEMKTKLNDLAKQGNADALSYFKAGSKEDKQKSLYKVVSSDLLGNEAKERYSSFEGSKDLNDYLDSAKRSSVRDLSRPEKTGWQSTKDFVSGPLMAMLKGGPGVPTNIGEVAAASMPEMDGNKTTFSKELEEASGIKSADKFTSLKAAGLAFKLASDQNINPGNIGEAMKSNKDLQAYSKLTGVTDGNELMKLATKSAVASRKSGLVSAAEVANSMNSSGLSSDDAIRRVSEINGGIHQNAIENAGDITANEAILGGVQERQGAREKAKNYELLKSGRIDYTTYKQTQNQLDQSKDIEKFRKSVETFAGAVDDMKKKDGGKNPLGLFSLKEATSSMETSTRQVGR